MWASIFNSRYCPAQAIPSTVQRCEARTVLLCCFLRVNVDSKGPPQNHLQQANRLVLMRCDGLSFFMSGPLFTVLFQRNIASILMLQMFIEFLYDSLPWVVQLHHPNINLFNYTYDKCPSLDVSSISVLNHIQVWSLSGTHPGLVV